MAYRGTVTIWGQGDIMELPRMPEEAAPLISSMLRMAYGDPRDATTVALTTVETMLRVGAWAAHHVADESVDLSNGFAALSTVGISLRNTLTTGGQGPIDKAFVDAVVTLSKTYLAATAG